VTTKNLRITAEAPLPEPVTENDNLITAGLIFFCQEGAAQEWLYLECREESGGDLQPVEKFGSVLSGQVGPPAQHQRGAVEGKVLISAVAIVQRRDRADRTIAPCVPDHHQSISFGVGKWPQQDSVDHAEYGCVGADPESQRE